MDQIPISMSDVLSCSDSDNKSRSGSHMSLSHASVPSPSNIQLNYSKMSAMSVPMTLLKTSPSSQSDCYRPYTFHGAQSDSGYLQQVAEPTAVPTTTTKFVASVAASHAGVPSLSTNNEYCSNPLMLGTNPHQLPSNYNYCSKTVLTTSLPYKKDTKIGPFRVRISNRVQPVVNSPAPFLCKQEFGVPMSNFQSRKFQDQTVRSQSLNKSQQPSSSNGRNVAHSFSSRKSRFAPSSGSSTSSSSGDEISHFQTDPGGGLGKRSGPGWWRKRENTTKVESSRASRLLPPRKWSTNSNSDSGFSSFSSNSSVNDSDQSMSSFLSHTPWTDKLTQPGFIPVPVPEPDSLPLPFEPVPPQNMMGMSAGYVSPLAEKPDQMFSTLKPGLDAKTRLKAMNHNRRSHYSPSSKPTDNKERRFKRTAEALQQSGLWEVASRTGKLMRQNQELQTELDTFKSDALNFLKSILKNSQNRNFIKQVINNALVTSSGTKNSSLVSSVMSVALKLGVYGTSSGKEGDSPQPDVSTVIPKIEIASPQENVCVPLLTDVTNRISPDVKVTLANDLTIPLQTDEAVARLADDFNPVDLSVVMLPVAPRLDGCGGIPIDVTLAPHLKNAVDFIDIIGVIPTVVPLLNEAVGIPVEVTAAIPQDITCDIDAGLDLCSQVETDMVAIDELIPAQMHPVQHMEIT